MNNKARIFAPVLMLVGTMNLSAQFPNFTPPTALLGALVRNDTAEVERLLAAGANPNEGQMIGFPPLFFAVFHHNLTMLHAMISHGANVKALDASGSSALMWASYDEAGRLDMVEELLKLDVDPKLQNKNDESALIWAMRRGETPIVAKLIQAGASTQHLIKPSVEKAIQLLQKSGVEFHKVSGCSSCHNQSLPQMAVASARQHGFTVDNPIAQQQVDAVVKVFTPMKDIMRSEPERIPDPATGLSYALVGLAAEGYQPDSTTSAMAFLISEHQLSDGHFRALPVRPPLESSEFTATALSLRALQLYGDQPEDRIGRARKWLETAYPLTQEDLSMRLLGLTWSKADSQHIQKAASALLDAQRPDGGWSQLKYLESDAYATGQALVALSSSGMLAPSDPAFQKGIRFLLRTQLPDGSWHVRSRSFPVQAYRESGFPHGKDQWISAAGTSWAALALTLADDPKPSNN